MSDEKTQQNLDKKLLDNEVNNDADEGMDQQKSNLDEKSLENGSDKAVDQQDSNEKGALENGAAEEVHQEDSAQNSTLNEEMNEKMQAQEPIVGEESLKSENLSNEIQVQEPIPNEKSLENDINTCETKNMDQQKLEPVQEEESLNVEEMNQQNLNEVNIDQKSIQQNSNEVNILEPVQEEFSNVEEINQQNLNEINIDQESTQQNSNEINIDQEMDQQKLEPGQVEESLNNSQQNLEPVQEEPLNANQQNQSIHQSYGTIAHTNQPMDQQIRSSNYPPQVHLNLDKTVSQPNLHQNQHHVHFNQQGMPQKHYNQHQAQFDEQLKIRQVEIQNAQKLVKESGIHKSAKLVGWISIILSSFLFVILSFFLFQVFMDVLHFNLDKTTYFVFIIAFFFVNLTYFFASVSLLYGVKNENRYYYRFYMYLTTFLIFALPMLFIICIIAHSDSNNESKKTNDVQDNPKDFKTTITVVFFITLCILYAGLCAALRALYRSWELIIVKQKKDFADQQPRVRNYAV